MILYLKMSNFKITYGRKMRPISRKAHSKGEFMTINNIKDVDKLRAEIYLYPLWLDCKFFNCKLPKGYSGASSIPIFQKKRRNL